MDPIELYDELTAGCTRPVRLEQLVRDGATRDPALLPADAELEAERARPLADKHGVELRQGEFASAVLSDPRTGRHLVESMLRPTPEALARLDQFRTEGKIDFGTVLVERRGSAGILELRNPRHLNAEDGSTIWPSEWAVDLILLDPQIELGVLRGGFVDHPRYPSQRIFGAGLNLTDLYEGRLDYLFFLVRDLAFVNKLFRGVLREDETVTEKLWVAAVERYAIGGACQLLHVVDHVIAARGSRLFLPARKEGIIPGASPLRLPRFVGDRAARQAILSGREWVAGEPDATLLCDEVVDGEEMDGAIEARIAALTDSGLVNAAANRAAIRIGEEPLDTFREYMALFAIEQARCHLSPALVRNLERHWRARDRAA
jgi:thioesterase DpgC